jgi:hypothetical protein
MFDVVVQFCDKPTGRGSFLFTERFFITDNFVVSATSLVCLCFVVLVNLEADGKVLVVKDKSEWASVFHEVASSKYKDHPPRPSSPINETIDKKSEDSITRWFLVTLKKIELKIYG